MDLNSTQQIDWLTSSWNRSSEAGLKQRRLPEDIRLAKSQVSERREIVSALISAVKEHALPLFNQMFARTDSRLILTDIEGVIIGSWGQERFKEKLTSIALETGVCWRENLKGTNAIGTAIVEAKPVSIIGDQHFIHQHRFISCSASPVFDFQGNMLGILDITSEQQIHNASTQLLVQNMVQLVENNLLCKVPNGSVRMDLALDQSLLTSGWQGIVIANEDGKIVAHNSVASQLLNNHVILGQPLDSVVQTYQENQPLTHLQEKSDLVYAVHSLKSAPKSVKLATYSPSCPLHDGDDNIEHAWQQANKVINKNISLLILGETGVGKGEFVKHLHQQSDRKRSPLITVNCGALPKELIESELFGYAPGAFTGASPKGYQGKIRQADKGILFLDEIADMPLEAQCRLLHVLQEKEVVPIGSNHSTKVDIQIIAATHKNLEKLVSTGEFRQDLFYRLNGLMFTLPALHERQDKSGLIDKIHAKYSSAEQTICPHLMQLLQNHSWPGNIRELDNLIKVSALLSEGNTLVLDDLPSHLKQLLMTASAPHQPSSEIKTDDLKTTVEEKLVQTFQANQGNISKTSRMLGISRNTLYRKLKNLGYSNK
ncbi:sigma-54-dependent Fis family transcriptional regulator [Vibrio cortegadensis]|nr:sigma-54-dependent Fis family transcriptional regulator [Vibrio cortegadensis]MDN3695954.1 sigma-54-dependent Fis family transcriptional regulator [Vibrio cortegadensis]